MFRFDLLFHILRSAACLILSLDHFKFPLPVRFGDSQKKFANRRVVFREDEVWPCLSMRQRIAARRQLTFRRFPINPLGRGVGKLHYGQFDKRTFVRCHGSVPARSGCHTGETKREGRQAYRSIRFPIKSLLAVRGPNCPPN